MFQRNSDKHRHSLFFSVITKFAMKHSLKEIERYYASKARYTPHVVQYYAAGARVAGLTDRELRRKWKSFSDASKGTDSPYGQPLNFVISTKSPSGGYQKKTIKIKKKKLNKRAVVTPSPNFFEHKKPVLCPSPPSCNANSRCNSTTKTETKGGQQHGWTPRHRLPITKVVLPVVKYCKKKINVSDMDKIREQVNRAKNDYYLQLNSENEDKAKVYLETLRIDEIPSKRLQKNFKKVFRAYSPTNEYENNILSNSYKALRKPKKLQ